MRGHEGRDSWRVQVGLVVAILMSTPFLMGPSCGENKQFVCETALELAQSYQVTGTCGPPGRILLSSRAQTCGLSVTGDNVGLPTMGSRINAPGVDVTKGGWSLGGELNGVFTRCPATAQGNEIHISCNTDTVAVLCTAVLVPVN